MQHFGQIVASLLCYYFFKIIRQNLKIEYGNVFLPLPVCTKKKPELFHQVSFLCISDYILSGAENPSRSIAVSSTSLVSARSAIQPAFLDSSSSARIFVSW